MFSSAGGYNVSDIKMKIIDMTKIKNILTKGFFLFIILLFKSIFDRRLDPKHPLATGSRDTG